MSHGMFMYVFGLLVGTLLEYIWPSSNIGVLVVWAIYVIIGAFIVDYAVEEWL